jgi:hypothetical protein
MVQLLQHGLPLGAAGFDRAPIREECFKMARLAFVAGCAVATVLVLNGGWPDLQAFGDKAWLIGLFPAVYLFGYALLKD